VRRLLAPPPPEGLRPGPVPRFSIIIAAYQAAHVVGEAVESALGQTLAPFEVVVCDDGSTDDIEGALAPYRDRILLLRKENGGEASAKNAAARAAGGDFVVLLDADDLFLPERLEALGELAAARPDLDILTTDAVLELDGRPVRRCYTEGFTFPVDDQRAAILERNFVFGHAAVRREKLVADGGFDESIRFTTDWERWIRLILEGSRAGCCAEPLARYRLLPGSLSSQRARMLEGRIATLSKTLSHPALSSSERASVKRTLEHYGAELPLARAREALLEGHDEARARAFAVARTAGLSPATRLKAAFSALFPRLARRLLGRRPRETTAGILVPPE
jgi:hypothetical protein